MSSVKRRRVAIVGRGIAGLTAAYHLIKAGFLPTLYGSKRNGEQASRAAQGVLCNKGLFFYQSPLFQAKIESLASMQAFLEELETVTGCPIPRFFQGVFEPYWNSADFQATVTRVYRHKFWGAHGTELSTESILDGATTQPLGWLTYPRDGWFDPVAVLDALEVYLHKMGAVFREEELTHLELAKDQKVLLQTKEAAAGDSFDQIILAAGAGSQALWHLLGVTEPRLFLIGGQTLRFAHTQTQTQSARVSIAVKGNQSLAVLPHEIILGSSSWPGLHSNDLDADAAALRSRAEESFGLRCTGAYQSRSGTRLRCKDRMPLVGFLATGPFAQKVYLLTGFYKNGMHLAETCAREMLCDLTGRPSERRFLEFSPARFGL